MIECVLGEPPDQPCAEVDPEIAAGGDVVRNLCLLAREITARTGRYSRAPNEDVDDAIVAARAYLGIRQLEAGEIAPDHLL